MGLTARVRTIDSAQYEKRMETFDYDMAVEVFGQSLSPGNEQREYWGSQAAGSGGVQPQSPPRQEPGYRRVDRGADPRAGPRRPRRPHPCPRSGVAVRLLHDPEFSPLGVPR